MKTMNKEDWKDHVLMLPAWLTEFISHLLIMPNGFVIKPKKNDHLVFHALFMLHMDSKPFNHYISLGDESDIIFGGSWIKYLTVVYNLRISHPCKEIYILTTMLPPPFASANTIPMY
jgi:hypothetical protein